MNNFLFGKGFDILLCVGLNPDSCQSKIARISGHTFSFTCNAIKQGLNQKLINRVSNDGRSYKLMLTKKGERVRGAIMIIKEALL